MTVHHLFFGTQQVNQIHFIEFVKQLFWNNLSTVLTLPVTYYMASANWDYKNPGMEFK